MDYEDIIEQIGGFGRWQIFIFTAIISPDIFAAMALMVPIFIGAEPPWSCENDFGVKYNNITKGSNVTLIIAEDRNVTDPDMGKGEFLCNNCAKRVFEGDFTSIVSEWDLVCEKDYISDLISSIQMSGMLIGAGVLAQISDTFGRKKAQFACVFILGVSGICSAFAINWQMFAVFRFLLGTSTGGYFCLNCVYPMEFISRKWRTLCGTIGFWAIGQSLLALSAYLIRDWQHLILCTAVPVLLYMPLWLLIPESPRWLAQHGRIKEAKQIFSQIAKRNGQQIPDLSCLDVLQNGNFANKKIEKKYTYLDLFKSLKIAKLTIINMLVWGVIFLTFWEIAFNVKHLLGNRYLNQFIASIMDLSGMLFILIFNNILGRRICLMITILGTIVSNIGLFVIYFLNHEDGSMTNAFALIGKSFSMAGIYSLQIYTAEQFPTDIRNIGVGAGSVVARVGALLAPLLLYAGTRVKILPCTLMGLLGILVLPLCLLLPETNGKPLEDDFNLFSGNTGEKSDDQKVKTVQSCDQIKDDMTLLYNLNGTKV